MSGYLGIKRNLTAEKGIPGLISLSLSWSKSIQWFFVFSTTRQRLCKQRNTHHVPLAWSAPQDYCLPLSSSLHFGSTQSPQTLEQSLPSASAKEISGGWRWWRENQQTHTEHLFFPQSQEKDWSDGHNSQRRLWNGHYSGVTLLDSRWKQLERGAEWCSHVCCQSRLENKA